MCLGRKIIGRVIWASYGSEHNLIGCIEFPFILKMDVDIPRGEGFRSYYITKIEELQLVVAEKSQNLRRLQAQRNELNAKGE